MGYDAEIEQPLDRSDWEQREVYAHFGVAIYFCQVVETGLVNYLLLLRRATAADEISETEIDELFVELFGNTLGRNINNVKRVLGEHGEWVLADQMTETLKLRNELVHHWMRTRSLMQGASEMRQAMIEERKVRRPNFRTRAALSRRELRRCWTKPVFLMGSWKRNISA